MNTKDLLHKISGRKWKPAKPGRRWQDNPQFTQYFDTSICPAHETGVAGAIRNAAGGKPLAKGVAIGAGTGQNERALVGAGLVEHFDLYEVSADRIATARQQAAEAGISEHFSEYLEDALLSDKIEEYDLVYWQMSLHHMFDVDHAIAWSVRALKPHAKQPSAQRPQPPHQGRLQAFAQLHATQLVQNSRSHKAHCGRNDPAQSV